MQWFEEGAANRDAVAWAIANGRAFADTDPAACDTRSRCLAPARRFV